MYRKLNPFFPLCLGPGIDWSASFSGEEQGDYHSDDGESPPGVQGQGRTDGPTPDSLCAYPLPAGGRHLPRVGQRCTPAATLDTHREPLQVTLVTGENQKSTI